MFVGGTTLGGLSKKYNYYVTDISNRYVQSKVKHSGWSAGAIDLTR